MAVKKIQVSRSENLNVRMLPPVLKEFRKLATKKNKTVTEYLDELIIEELRQHDISIEVTLKII